MTRKNISKFSKIVDDSLIPRGDDKRFRVNQVLIFIITFGTYTLYHANRKVISVVKSEWSQNCSSLPDDINHNDSNWCDWAPFDDSNADSLLGGMDASFLTVYAVSMFASGYFAERINLRYYLSMGMLMTGFFNLLIAGSYWLDIHSFTYLMIFNSLGGVAQATGWPSVVTLMGNWFGKSKRGFIMGVWNMHTSVGNMLGSMIAGIFVSTDWGLSFAVPAISIAAFSLVVFFVVVPQPADVGLENPNRTTSQYTDGSDAEHTRLLADTDNYDDWSNEGSEYGAGAAAVEDTVVTKRSDGVTKKEEEINRASSSSNAAPVASIEEPTEKAISLFDAALIPGVLTFAIALFFVKFVNYVFMYWLPKYIFSSTSFSASYAAYMSMFFDMGGIFGGMTAGALSDRFKKPANVCFWMLLCSLPMLLIYLEYGTTSIPVSCILLIITGFFVNAPYALITTAVSAALGTHESLQGNAKALATVSALIDGTGSLGAALGPFMTGIMENNFGWNSVFYMLFLATVVAMLCLVQLVYRELKSSLVCCGRERRPSDQEPSIA